MSNIYWIRLIVVAFAVSCASKPSGAAYLEGTYRDGNETHWNYDPNDKEDGPSGWSTKYPECGGNKQSPVDLVGREAKQLNVSTIVFKGYDHPPADPKAFLTTNNGHSVQVTVDAATARTMSISEGGLPGTYILEQFHFHWGEASGLGSEHTYDGVGSAMEVHLVHRRDKFADLAAAVASKEQDAVAVLGVFVAELQPGNLGGSNISGGLASLAQSLGQISKEGDVMSVKVFALYDLLPPSEDRGFFRYSGSLTTPGCNEVAVWTVFNKPIYLFTDQINLFRTKLTSGGHPLTHNYRPVQSLGNRTVYFIPDKNTVAKATGGAQSLHRCAKSSYAIIRAAAATATMHLLVAYLHWIPLTTTSC